MFMMMSEGGFVWYEIMSSDRRRLPLSTPRSWAGAWTESSMPGIDYTLAKIGERQVAGLMGFAPDPPTGPVMWLGYIFVADVDAMAERVTRRVAPCIVHQPTSQAWVGFAAVADPQGAIFMLFRGSGEPAPELVANTPGTIGRARVAHHGLAGRLCLLPGPVRLGKILCSRHGTDENLPDLPPSPAPGAAGS